VGKVKEEEGGGHIISSWRRGDTRLLV